MTADLLKLDWPVEVTLSDAAGTPCVDVPAQAWLECVSAARDQGFTFFDWLSAVDELDSDPAGIDVVVHLARIGAQGPRDPAGPGLQRLLVRTRVSGGWQDVFELHSLTTIFAGAGWHERETFEMFGVQFTDFDDGSGAGLRPLLLPDGFEGTPLRKSFVLAARAVKAWPGAKEPGEGGQGAPSRRKALPMGVPADWGTQSEPPDGHGTAEMREH